MKRMIFIIIVGTVLCGVPAASADVIRTEVADNFTNTSSALYGRSGAYVYHPWRTGTSYSQYHSIDLNGDGVEDFRFAGRPSSIRLECAEGNAAWCLQPNPNVIGDIERLFPLEKGDLVGETVSGWSADSGGWLNSDVYVNSYMVSLTLPPAPQVIANGLYQFGTEAYAGLRFQIGTNTHYGCVYIEDIDPGPGVNPLGAAFVVRFAYEDQPDTPIEIIPEPGSVAMWLGGAGLLTLYRRERARCRKHPDDMRQRIKR
jgi:hypothetical protein